MASALPIPRSTSWLRTSVGVPIFAGVVSLLNQKMKVSQGNINPRLYALSASAPYIFHDITSGDNKVPCQSGTPDCPSGGTIGFTAGTGYDQVTGLGSVDVYSLVNNWDSTQPLASADFGVTLFDTAMTLTRGTAATMPIILQRRNGFNGTVALTCSIATVTNATCSVSPNSLNPDGAVLLTVTTTALASSHSPFSPWWETAFGVAAFFSLGEARRNKRKILLVACLMAVLCFGLVSCGGGSSTSSSSSSGGTTTAQSGTVTVTATSGSLSHTAQLNITVN